MQDRFEHFVREHRDEFDYFEPREQLWEDIQDKLKQQSKLKRWRSLSAAASVLLIVTCAIALTQAFRQKAVVVSNNVPGWHNSETPNIQQAEYYYASLVVTKYSELGKYCNDHPRLCKEFGKDLETLNVSYSQLKKEYSNSGNEAVLQAMIENLQMQVQLLAEQLQIIRDVEQQQHKTISI